METFTEVMGAVFGVFGMILIGKKIRFGWVAWMISDVFLIILAIIASYWWFLLLSILYLVNCIYWWFDWKPEPIETNYG